jgi:hypothetical protein
MTDQEPSASTDPAAPEPAAPEPAAPEPAAPEPAAPEPAGGLVALAVLNFVFGGIGAIQIVSPFLQSSAPPGAEPRLLVWLFALTHALLIASGVGYLLRRRFLGWVVGNAFAICAIGAVVWLFFVDRSLIQVPELVGLAYALVTLGLINTLYRKILSG